MTLSYIVRVTTAVCASNILAGPAPIKLRGGPATLIKALH